MDNQFETTHSGIIPKTMPRIYWSAIFSGAFIGVGLGFLLQLYGVAIGLSAYSSSSSGATQTIAIGGFLGLLLGVIASMGIAGFVSGYLGRFHYCNCHGGIIYGFLTWSIALALSAIMVLPLSQYASAYTKAVSPTISVSNSFSKPVEVKPDANTSSMKETEGTQPSVKVTPTTLTSSSWVIFILFFLGAISCCVGACWGMVCKNDCPPASRMD